MYEDNIKIFNEDKLKLTFERLTDDSTDISTLQPENGIEEEIKGCIDSDYQYLLNYSDIDSVVVLRKALDLQLSKHTHKISDLELYVRKYREGHDHFNLPIPGELFRNKSFVSNSALTAQKVNSCLDTRILYRKVCFQEYMEIYNKRELPCSGNFFSPDGLWKLSHDGHTQFEGDKYSVLLEFTLNRTLKKILEDVSSHGIIIYKEAGRYLDTIDSIILTSYPGNNTELKVGLKHESDCISFRMGNGRTTGKCYLPIIQNELQSIAVKEYNIQVQNNAYDAYMLGDKKERGIKFYELYDYLRLLINGISFEQ